MFKFIFGLAAIAVVATAILTTVSIEGLPMFGQSDSIASVFFPLAGPFVALIVGAFAWLSYLMNRTAARSTRFQKAAELTAGDKVVGRIAGVASLEVLANEDRSYARPVLETLGAALAEENPDLKKVFKPFVTNVEFVAVVLPPSTKAALAALAAIGRLTPRHGGWRLDPETLVNGRLHLHDVYLCAARFIGERFRCVDFASTILNQVVFSDCNFSDSVLRLHSQQMVRFDNCNLTNVHIELYDWGAVEIREPVVPKTRLSFTGGNWTNAFVWGMPLADWVRDQPDADE
jgi:hypothetical protein